MRIRVLLLCIIASAALISGCSDGKEEEKVCENCGSNEHTISECHLKAEETKCGLCGSGEHETDNHPKCADCGSINHLEDECGEDAVVRCSFCGADGHDISGCPHLGGK